jgi:hypothetical protein
VSYMDLVNWVNNNSAIPDNDHTLFVIKSHILVNDLVPEASTIRISISTKTLLKNAMKTRHLCADATYKLIWHSI